MVWPKKLKPLRVLIIDSHAPHAGQLSAFCRTFTTHVEVVSSASLALKKLREEGMTRPDLIFIDHRQQANNQEPLTGLIRRLFTEKDCPVFVVMTDDKSIHSTRQIQAAGIRYYIFKPVMQKELRNLLHRIFRIELNLPLADPGEAENVPELKPRRPLTILLAEDQLINQKIVVQLLAKKGWEVIPSVNGSEALKKACESEFDLILMDVMMPEMDGFEATRRIRTDSLSKNRNTPIVALTANAMKGDREKCLGSGMDDYISKPIQPENVFLTIEKYCYK
jgi:CheY-like chemotaxis protein